MSSAFLQVYLTAAIFVIFDYPALQSHQARPNNSQAYLWCLLFYVLKKVLHSILPTPLLMPTRFPPCAIQQSLETCPAYDHFAQHNVPSPTCHCLVVYCHSNAVPIQIVTFCCKYTSEITHIMISAKKDAKTCRLF